MSNPAIPSRRSALAARAAAAIGLILAGAVPLFAAAPAEYRVSIVRIP